MSGMAESARVREEGTRTQMTGENKPLFLRAFTGGGGELTNGSPRHHRLASLEFSPAAGGERGVGCSHTTSRCWSRPWLPRRHGERSMDERQTIDGEADWVEGATGVAMGEESAVGRVATRRV